MIKLFRLSQKKNIKSIFFYFRAIFLNFYYNFGTYKVRSDIN